MSKIVQFFLLCFQVSIVQINKEIVQIGTNFYKIVEICLNLLKLVKTCPILSKLVKTWFFMFSGIYWAHHPLNRVKQWRIMPSKSFLKNIFLLPVWVHQEGFVWLSAFNQIKPSSSGAPRPEEEKYSSRSSNRALSSIASPCREDDEPNI